MFEKNTQKFAAGKLILVLGAQAALASHIKALGMTARVIAPAISDDTAQILSEAGIDFLITGSGDTLRHEVLAHMPNAALVLAEGSTEIDAVISDVMNAARARRVPVLVMPASAPFTRYRGADCLLLPAALAASAGAGAVLDSGVAHVLVLRGVSGLTLLSDDAAPLDIAPFAQESRINQTDADHAMAAAFAVTMAQGAEPAGALLSAMAARSVIARKKSPALVFADELSSAFTGEDGLEKETAAKDVLEAVGD